MKATIYFRGSLSSCNYDCPYCPFSKNTDSQETLAKDRLQVQTFVDWVRNQEDSGHQLSVFFNPYGEGLTHRWYREALAQLSHMHHVDKVAIQTNLSANLDWTSELNPVTAAFWVTYHPGQTEEERFLRQCGKLYEQKIHFSVGCVGVKSAFHSISSLRKALPEDVYMWVNAYKDKRDYYSAEDTAFLSRIDPYFVHNAKDYDSLGKPCRAGHHVFYVQGDGRVKRCYKDRQVIGNLYKHGLEGISKESPCRMKQCDCYIGYIHMEGQPFERIYGDRLLERIAMLS
ncbi:MULTISPECIES: STM4011 family radical SAM protein [Paenibacillus]|uniref:STM4011 family radical SAM protein n=1 Tax=Paenibacillus TaxID=44249 RepID=UPI0022B8E523|nr:STM4011 family radical SAM protein [Paenibacillus caseinilyticus]MCZ8521337.1 STM4011 family radical SAM protein [Paenibacillus caseinilyticus]